MTKFVPFNDSQHLQLLMLGLVKLKFKDYGQYGSNCRISWGKIKLYILKDKISKEKLVYLSTLSSCGKGDISIKWGVMLRSSLQWAECPRLPASSENHRLEKLKS